jgi:hypothetical protein
MAVQYLEYLKWPTVATTSMWPAIQLRTTVVTKARASLDSNIEHSEHSDSSYRILSTLRSKQNLKD